MSGSGKWISAQALELVLDAEAPSADRSGARELDPDKIVRLGGRVTLKRLVNGTHGGLSVVVFQVDGDDGSTVLSETSLRLLDSAVQAFKAADELGAAAVVAALKTAPPVAPPPVDRSARVTLSGAPATPGVAGAPQPINPATGQHGDYWVLSAEERAKGYVKPLRDSYRHDTCGATTTMGGAIASTYARDPHFYTSTFCVRCRGHFPLAEFTWLDGRGDANECMDPAKVPPPT